MTNTSLLDLISTSNALAASLGDIEEAADDATFIIAEDAWCRLERKIIFTKAVDLEELAAKVRHLFLTVSATGFYRPPAEGAEKAERLAWAVLRDIEAML